MWPKVFGRGGRSASPTGRAADALLFRRAGAIETAVSKDPEQASPTYTPTPESVRHGLDADQLHHYLNCCSEMLSLTAKTAALCAEHSADGVVLETISYIETLTTELCNKIWQKISLLPRA